MSGVSNPNHFMAGYPMSLVVNNETSFNTTDPVSDTDPSLESDCQFSIAVVDCSTKCGFKVGQCVDDHQEGDSEYL